MAEKVIQRKQARAIGEIILEAAREALKSEGLTVSRKGGLRYNAGTVTIKLEAALPAFKDEMGESNSLRLGFSENIVGKTFHLKRSTYTITGINMRRYRYPISAENQNGKGYKFPASYVANLLGVTYNGR